VPSASYAILKGLLNKKLAKVELAPGPPLSQIATGALGSVEGYIHQNSWELPSALPGRVPAYEQGHVSPALKPGS